MKMYVCCFSFSQMAFEFYPIFGIFLVPKYIMSNSDNQIENTDHVYRWKVKIMSHARDCCGSVDKLTRRVYNGASNSIQTVGHIERR